MKVMKIAGGLLAAIFCFFILWFWAALAWIKFQPVPPVPRATPEYSVAAVENISPTLINPNVRNPFIYGVRLNDDGRVVEVPQAEPKATRDYVVAVAASGHKLIANSNFQLVRDTNRTTSVSSKRIQGYDWEIYNIRFHALNARDEIIGNARIATAFASSGGTSAPHGRHMALLWKGDETSARDLNSLIAAASGWYLDQAIDINERGQILCAARQTDERGAEDTFRPKHQWIVLTPTRGTKK